MTCHMRHALLVHLLSNALFLLVFVCLFIGCAGTTHHFLPPRPLEEKEVMISWSWNHDFNKWQIPTVVPSVNVYTGLKNHDNIGVGIQLSGITHISYARYSSEANSNRSFFYVHFNQPLGTIHNNPYFELGGGYTAHRGGTYHMLSAGLSLGHGMNYGLFELLPRLKSQRKDASDFTHIWRIIPTLKYAAIGRNVSASLSYYYGMSDLIYDNIANATSTFNDTILFVNSDDIDSVGTVTETYYGIYDTPAIFLSNDSTIDLYQETFVEIDINMFSTWSPMYKGSDYRFGRIFIEERGFAFGSLNNLLESARLGNDLLITKYSDSIMLQLQKPGGFWKDLSVGVGAMDFH